MSNSALSAVPSLTEMFAIYICNAQENRFTPEDRALATRSLIDTVGVTIAARGERALQILRSALGGPHSRGRSTIIFSREKADESTAALFNGVAGHLLDFDDVSDVIYGHPSIVLWSAALAVGESRRVTREELINSFIVGFAIEAASAAGFQIRQHYGEGWHSTATIGVLGAAAVSATLMRLNVMQARHALGIAASMAAGSRQNFGTMTKSLHVGVAARDGVIAATLAANGFTADITQLESPMGYFAMYGDPSRLKEVAVALQEPSPVTRYGLNVKRYPSCYNTHRTADALLSLISKYRLTAEEVHEIKVTMEPGGLDPLISTAPTSGMQGKFSCEYVVATALLDGAVNLKSFRDDAVHRPQAQELLKRVSVSESELPPLGRSDWEHAYAVVEVDSTRGRFAERVDVPRGHWRRPLDDSEVESKFIDNIEFAGGGWNAQQLLERLKQAPSIAEVWSSHFAD